MRLRSPPYRNDGEDRDSPARQIPETLATMILFQRRFPLSYKTAGAQVLSRHSMHSACQDASICGLRMVAGDAGNHTEA